MFLQSIKSNFKESNGAGSNRKGFLDLVEVKVMLKSSWSISINLPGNVEIKPNWQIYGLSHFLLNTRIDVLILEV